MPISMGLQQYEVSAPPVAALGLSYSDQELDDALTAEVHDIFMIRQAKKSLRRFLAVSRARVLAMPVSMRCLAQTQILKIGGLVRHWLKLT